MNDGVAGDDFLLGFASWRDSPRVFMRMRDATVSLKTRLNKVCYRIQENFRVGMLSRLVHKMTIRRKTFAVHQAVANIYCTQQVVIQGENFCDRLKNRKKRGSFPTRKFSRIRY